MPLLTPKLRFRLNRMRNRWFHYREAVQETGREVFVEQKMCPACRALVDRHSRQCPYCGEPLRVIGTGPAARIASRLVPTNVPVTSLLILGNVLMFAIEWIVGHHSFNNLAFDRLGATLPLPWEAATGQYWRWVTAMFLHAGILHIGFNMWALYDLGPVCESLYGPAKFLTLYLATGIFGNIVASWTGSAVIGASGALFGLLGLLAMYGLRRRDSAARQMRSQATRWIIYALIWTFLIPGISLAAHMGGLVSGLALGYLVSDEPPLTEASIGLWRGVGWAAVVITLGSFYLMARSPL